MGKNIHGKELGEGLSQRKDGRYSARFKSRSGKRVEKYFDKLPDAKKWLRQAKYDDEHSNISASSDMTVDCWFDVWFEQKKQQCRKGTYRNYENIYKLHIKPYIGSMILSDIKPIHCQNIINEISREIKASSIQNVKTELNSIFQYAVNNDLIAKNPVMVKLPKKAKKERRVLTKGEQSLFIETAKDCTYFNTYNFVLQTGLRCGELTGLKWSDVNFNQRTITISRSVDYDKDQKCFAENPTKTESGQRTIPLTNCAYEILIEQKRANKEKPTVLGYHEYVFINKNGKPTQRSDYNKMLSIIAKKMDVEPFSMHTLRHTFATRCIEAGMKPKTLQKLLGHTDIGLTMNLYVHTTADEMTREMLKFENMSCDVKAV